MTSSTFTIYFDGRHWVGVLERHDDGVVRAASVVFGAEPTDAELWEWQATSADALVEQVGTAAPVSDAAPARLGGNPKRRQREAARAARAPVTSTAAQRALTADRDARGRERAAERTAESAREAQDAYAARRARAKARHRGR